MTKNNKQYKIIKDMDKQDSVWRKLDMMMIPVTHHTLRLGNEFILTDNFGLQLDAESTSRFVGSGYPFKINFIIILMCTQGYMQIKLSLKEFRLEAGNILIVLPGLIGECTEFSNDCQVALIAYGGNKLFDEPNSSFAAMFHKYLTKQPIIPLSAEEMEEQLIIYQLMRRKMQHSGFHFIREALNGYMQVLYSNGYQWISNYYQQEVSTVKEDRPHELFNKFLDLVQQHYIEERNISFYADKLCITPKYLSSLIHQASGRFAGDWIKDYVILEAKTLLKSRQYSVAQICDKLHFTNASFFGKYFKEAVGCSPRKYMME